jgi:hypothetical protein
VTNLVQLSIPIPSNETETRAQAALDHARSVSIVTAEQYEAGAAELQAIKGKWKEIDEARKELKRPIDEAAKRIQSFFAKPLDFLAQAESIIKGKLVAYQNEQDRLRREEQRKAEEAARKERERLEARAAKAAADGRGDKAEQLAEKAATVVAPVIQREAPKVAGIKTREVWLFEVTDPAAVPNEYKVVDESRVRRVVQALKGDTSIAGVRVWKENAIAAGSR